MAPADSFVCPLCREIFSREALDCPNPGVSLAHIVTEALGGRRYTLTCTDCNNRIGTELESHLVEKFRYDAWTQGVGIRSARMSGEFGEVGAQFQLSKDTSNWAIYFDLKQSNPAHFERLKHWLACSGGRPNPELTWTMKWSARFTPPRVCAAIIQSAYLLMFDYYGYEFAFHPHYEPTRNFILNPQEGNPPQNIAWLDEYGLSESVRVTVGLE